MPKKKKSKPRPVHENQAPVVKLEPVTLASLDRGVVRSSHQEVGEVNLLHFDPHNRE